MQDEDKTVIQTLYVFMTVALAGATLILISSLITSGGVFTSLAISGLVGLITCLIVLWLLRIHQYWLPRLILPSVVYLLATYLIFTGTTVSVRDDAVALYSLVVAMAGLLLGKRGVIVFGSLSALTVVSSVYAEINGLIANHITPATTTYNTLLTVSVTYGLTFTMMYILVNILTTNLAKMRTNQNEITEINQELWTIRESLERQVVERTRAAEAARTEAEAARLEAESQSWITRGQAQLAEKMRGELDISTLANNVTGYLSRYIGAQCGALFLASGDVLKLTGRYAYVLQEGQKSEFRMGEGLVGEAARSKRIIRVDEIPADAPLIFSALGESTPRQILVAPLEWNGQVFGVVEFATLGQFTPVHEHFLARISENTAFALRATQIRLQMSESVVAASTQIHLEKLQAQADNRGTDLNE